MEKCYHVIKRLLLIGPFIFFFQHVNGQHDQNEHEIHGHHKLSALTGHSFVLNKFVDDKNDFLLVPTFGLSYDYLINQRWSVGISSSVILQQFQIETYDGSDTLVRDNPVAICLLAAYSPLKHFYTFIGYGLEIEHNKTLDFVRLGCKYEIPIRKNWEVGFDFEMDFKIKYYSSFLLGVSFSKTF